MKRQVRIGLFGSGRVGGHLLRAFDRLPEVEVAGVWTRHPGRHSVLAGRRDLVRRPEDMPEADVYVLALKDDAVGEFSRHLAGRRGLTVHTSGAVPSTVLQTRRRGVFYPLQTFTEHTEPDWTAIPLLVYAQTSEDTALLERLARMLTPEVFRVDDDQRARLHTAAVFVSNFTNAMVQIGEELNREAGLPEELLKPLLEATFRNILEKGAEAVLTGPARRGDIKTIEKHLRLLSEGGHRTEKDIYEAVSRWILRKFSH